jgi:hypothetical protein
MSNPNSGSHTPTPWMTQRCGELAPNDVMIVADMGKPNGIQQISTVAKALSIRQTPEVTAANAAFIVEAVNSYASLKARISELEANEKAYEEIIGPMTYRQVADRIKELEGALRFYADEWRLNGDGDSETPGLSRSWMEPTDALHNDEGRKARDLVHPKDTAA